MVSSAQSCGVELRERTEWRGSYIKPSGEHVPARVERLGWVAEGAVSKDQIEAVIGKVDAAMTPATSDQIEMWLVELSVITARRIDAPAAEELRVTAYASRLADYPADIAREALVVRPWRFFPSWAEIHAVCEELVKPRREMRRALEAAAWAAKDREIKARALPTEQTRVETADEAAERRARVRAMADDVIAGLNAKSAQQQAEAKAQDDAISARMTARSAPSMTREGLEGLVP